MLVKGHRRLLIAIGSSLAFIAIAVLCTRQLSSKGGPFEDLPRLWNKYALSASDLKEQKSQQSLKEGLKKPEKEPVKVDHVATKEVAESHHEIFSSTTKDGKYFPIEFGDIPSMNPNIIAHPSLPDTWIIVAQRWKNTSSAWFTELVCETATFSKGKLQCPIAPLILPIAQTRSPNCRGDLSHFSLNIGPHDARVFNGPEMPYIVYGSQSSHNCFGQWIQDFRLLVDWGGFPPLGAMFQTATDIQRPPPYGPVEKNWFLFWDYDDEAYVHYDIAPQRVFAKVNADGTVGDNLAPFAAVNDDSCWRKHLRDTTEHFDSIHQATNSLSITMCKRKDLSCKKTKDNTYIMTIFQHKSYKDYHSVYEPYIMLFKPQAPFEIHGISSKPIWIHGRGKAGELRPTGFENEANWNQTEMFYVTSMSWKKAGLNYHGFLDDIVFLGFGREDEKSAGIDVVAADLVRGVDQCKK